MTVSIDSSTEDRTTILVNSIWEAVFDTAIQDDSDFFSLGGDSLAALSICSKIEEILGKRPKLRLLFDNPRFGDYRREVAKALAVEGVT